MEGDNVRWRGLMGQCEMEGVNGETLHLRQKYLVVSFSG